MFWNGSTAIEGLSGRGADCGGGARAADTISTDRLGDILDLLLAEIGEDDGQFGADLVAHCAGDADPAGLGQRFEPRGDIDTVAKQILALDDDIADMHADARRRICSSPVWEAPSLAIVSCTASALWTASTALAKFATTLPKSARDRTRYARREWRGRRSAAARC